MKWNSNNKENNYANNCNLEKTKLINHREHNDIKKILDISTRILTVNDGMIKEAYDRNAKLY